MGDRCYLTMRFLKSDKDVVVKALDSLEEEVEVEDDLTLLAEIHEANYGLGAARRTLAKSGIAFVGWHSSGSEYDYHVFAAAGGVMEDVRSDSNGAQPVVPVESDGTILQAYIDDARRYYLKFAEAEAILEGEDPRDAHNKASSKMSFESVSKGAENDATKSEG